MPRAQPRPLSQQPQRMQPTATSSAVPMTHPSAPNAMALATSQGVRAYTSTNRNNSPSSVYAFDADLGSLLWRHQFAAGLAQFTTCAPVIDASTCTMYVLTKDTNTYGNTSLHALDITTGLEKPGSPVLVQAAVPGTGDGSVGGVLPFVSAQQNERPGLLFLNGNVYFACSDLDHYSPFNGWVFGYSYNGSAFTQTGVFCTTPNGSLGGIWQAGQGIAADSDGYIYVATGNGTFDANTGGNDYGMSYVKLATPSLSVVDYFSPYDELEWSSQDYDLAGGGIAGIAGTDRFFAGGTKFGSVFLVDTSNMGKFNPTTDHVLQRLDNISVVNSTGQNPVTWDTGSVKYIYLWPSGNNLMQFNYDPAVGMLNPAGVYKLSATDTDGGALAVSADGGTNGILWAQGWDDVLYAFNAIDVSQADFWDSSKNPTRDGLTKSPHLSFPTVVNGKVYAPAGDTIAVFGLLSDAVPTGLTAVAGNTQVTLFWSASPGAASYNVYRSTVSGGEGATAVGSADGPSYTDTGLTNGVIYYYTVAAVTHGGTSAQSGEASATPSAALPLAPTGLIASEANNQVVLSWAGVAGVRSYNVYRATATGAEGSTAFGTSSSTTFTDTGLTSGVTYCYKVAAVSGSGTSAQSSEASSTLTPVTPSGVKALSGNAQVVLLWISSIGATSYNVYRGTASGAEGATAIGIAANTFYTDTGLANGATYFYTVAAVNGGGTSGLSSESSATPEPPIPAVPTALSATSGNAQVSLSWTASTGATSFNVYRGTASGAEGSTSVGPATTTSYSDTGLTNGVAYFYEVAAVNAGGTSPLSSEASATPAPQIPGAPAGLTGTAGNSQVALSWTASTGAASYCIYRGTATGAEAATAIVTGITAVNYTNRSVTNGTTYFYTVAAVNSSGTSPPSNEASATPEPPIPSVPFGLTASAGNTQVSLTWTGGADATSYNVYRGTS
ncbi:MAG: fibronectin type III domain-containing protein, partial [Capsulimonadaceae bacterium]